MLHLAQGNLLGAPTEALVNAVNTVGVMGKGIALQFKRSFPANFDAYARACEAGEVQIGKVFEFDTGELRPRWILNVPTKRHWRARSEYAYVGLGIEALVSSIKRLRIRSVAVPALGCGAGGLLWEIVGPPLAYALASLADVDVHLYAPSMPEPAHNLLAEEAEELTPEDEALLSEICARPRGES